MFPRKTPTTMSLSKWTAGNFRQAAGISEPAPSPRRTPISRCAGRRQTGLDDAALGPLPFPVFNHELRQAHMRGRLGRRKDELGDRRLRELRINQRQIRLGCRRSQERLRRLSARTIEQARSRRTLVALMTDDRCGKSWTSICHLSSTAPDFLWRSRRYPVARGGFETLASPGRLESFLMLVISDHPGPGRQLRAPVGAAASSTNHSAPSAVRSRPIESSPRVSEDGDAPVGVERKGLDHILKEIP